MAVKRRKPRSRLVTPAGIRTQPRIDEGTDEPRPDRALVIGGITRAQVAEVLRLEILVTGSSVRKP